MPDFCIKISVTKAMLKAIFEAIPDTYILESDIWAQAPLIFGCKRELELKILKLPDARKGNVMKALKVEKKIS